MDAFFAAVEQRDNPELMGKPVVIGADPKGGAGRGVVSTASYEARKYGIHSAMPISKAYRLCPHAVFLTPDGKRYVGASRKIMGIIREFSPRVEEVGIDEAFLDATGMEMLYGSPPEIAKEIKARIRQITGLTASIGIATSKFVAKVASDLEKPDGLTICPPGREREFLDPLEIERLWGVGKKTAPLLHSSGFSTIGDIARVSDERIYALLKNQGLFLKRLALGIDERDVIEEHGRKSIGEERTFEKDVSEESILLGCLHERADALGRSIRSKGLEAHTVTLKIRLQGFETYTRSRTLSQAIQSNEAIFQTALELFRSFDRRGKRVRLIGISLSRLIPSEQVQHQMDLFTYGRDLKRARVESAVDTLRGRFGGRIGRGSSIDG